MQDFGFKLRCIDKGVAISKMGNGSRTSAAARANQLLAELQARVAQQQQPQRVLCARLKQLANNHLAQRYFNTQNNDGINNTIDELNTLFSNLSPAQQSVMTKIDMQENSDSIKTRARQIIVAFISGKLSTKATSSATYVAAESLAEENLSDQEMIERFFGLALEGEIDLAQFLSTETTALETGDKMAFNRIYTVLLAAEILSKEGSIPASSPPPGVIPIEVAKVEETTDEAINEQLKIRLVRGIDNNNVIFRKIPPTYKMRIYSILTAHYPTTIRKKLEKAITLVLNAKRQDIEEEINGILKRIRQDRQSNPRGLRDEEELYNRHLPSVETINDPGATERSIDRDQLEELQENFRLVLTIAAYYHSPAPVIPSYVDFVLARIKNRPNTVPAETAHALSQLDSQEKVLALMEKAGLNILEIDELSDAYLLKIGLPAEIQQLIGEDESYYCPQIKLPRFASEDMPFGSVLMNCLVPPTENQASAKKVLSAQAEILEKLANLLGANPSCVATGIKSDAETSSHEYYNRGFRFFFSPQPSQFQARVNSILNLYQIEKPSTRAERMKLYQDKVNARYCQDLESGQLRPHPVLEDVLPSPSVEFIPC